MFGKNSLAIACMLLSVAAHAQTGATYIAPTISTLSELQRAEIDKLNKKRMDALNPVAIVVAAPAAPAASAPAAAPSMGMFSQMPVMKPDTTKKVLAIYGKQGQEVAEIGMPNGTVIKVSPGYQGKGFKVISIDQTKVVLDIQPENSARKSKVKADKVRSDAKNSTRKKSAKNTKFIFLPVGGEFK